MQEDLVARGAQVGLAKRRLDHSHFLALWRAVRLGDHHRHQALQEAKVSRIGLSLAGAEIECIDGDARLWIELNILAAVDLAKRPVGSSLVDYQHDRIQSEKMREPRDSEVRLAAPRFADDDRIPGWEARVERIEGHQAVTAREEGTHRARSAAPRRVAGNEISRI